jgi:hypothetical protein
MFLSGHDTLQPAGTEDLFQASRLNTPLQDSLLFFWKSVDDGHTTCHWSADGCTWKQGWKDNYGGLSIHRLIASQVFGCKNARAPFEDCLLSQVLFTYTYVCISGLAAMVRCFRCHCYQSFLRDSTIDLHSLIQNT